MEKMGSNKLRRSVQINGEEGFKMQLQDPNSKK
jgi:hypothetical protein